MKKTLSSPAGRTGFVVYLVLLCLALPFFGAGCSVKPKPYSEGEFLALAQTDRQALMQGIPPLLQGGELSLQEAVVRALAFNFDHRLSLSENIAADRERVLTAMSMLPSLSAGATANQRSNEAASSSISYETRNVSLEPSFSAPRGRQFGDLSFSWSILDCGLSYYAAKQQADKVLITQERRRRTVNTIVKDVISTYYRARAAQQYLDRVTALLAEAEKALKQYKKLEKEQLEPLAAILEGERHLLHLIQQLRHIEGDLQQSRVQLAALCNFPARAPFTLTTQPFALPRLGNDVAQYEMIGLYRRPELREEHYQERIDMAGIKREILAMFPAIKFLGSFNWDTNPYLYHEHWSEAGLQASLDLVRLAAKGPAGLEAAQSRQDVSQMRRLALSMATLVQINLGLHQYQIALEDLKSAREMRNVEGRLLKVVTMEEASGAEGRLALVQQRAQALSTEMLHDVARVNAYTALGNFYFSIGVGLIDDLPPNSGILQTAVAVEKGIAAWSSGTLPAMPTPVAVANVDPPKVFATTEDEAVRKKELKEVAEKTVQQDRAAAQRKANAPDIQENVTPLQPQAAKPL